MRNPLRMALKRSHAGASGPLWAFTAGDGLTGAVVANGGNWDVTLTQTAGGASHTATFTTAQLNALEAHCVFAPVTSKTGNTFSAADLGWWFWPSSIDPVDFLATWKMAGIFKASGMSWDATADAAYYPVGGVTFTATPQYGTPVVLVAQAPAAYSRKQIQTSGTAYLAFGAGALANSPQMTFAVELAPVAVNVSQRIISNAATQVQFGSGSSQCTLTVVDSAGTTVGVAKFTLATGKHHYYFAVDLATVTGTVLVDGAVPGTLSWTTPLVAGTGLIKLSTALTFLAVAGGASGRFNGKVADMVFDTSIIANSILYNGGTPQLLDGLLPSTVKGYWGGYMDSATRLGDATKGWNDGYNQGTIAVDGSGSSFTFS